MDELLRQATIVLRGMWRYRWLGVATAWVVGVVGAAAVLFIQDKFEASARIFVNTASILKPLMSGMTVQPDIDQRIAMLSRVIISRPNVERLVRMAGLDAEAKSKEDFDKVVDKVIKTLEIRGSGRDNLYTLTFRDPDPERAKRVIELLSSIFIESGEGRQITDTDAAKKFIDDQIAVYEKKLKEAENRLKEFKLRNLGMSPGGDVKDFFASVSDANNKLSQAELELREAENSRDAIRRQLAMEAPGSVAGAASATDGWMSDIDGRIDAMRRNLDGLLQKYTDSHPDVVGTRRVIKELEDQRRQMIVAHKNDRTPVAPPSPTVLRAYEQIKVSLAQAEAKVAELRTRVAEYSARASRLRESAKMIPQLEAEYSQLNRDYDVNKKNYENLVSRRESASISGDMQSVSGVADFRLIDPPRVSPRPVAPNRLILLPLALALALGAGFAAAFVARELRPTFYDGRSLREGTGLPLLGTVSLLPNPERALLEKKRLLQFLSSVGALLGTYAVGFVTLMLLTVRVV